jgi:3-deoxy-7-phosphoheptulonate synthase
MRATREAGRRAIWSVDPMHGNTVAAGGFKTRFLGDIVAEMTDFFDIADSEGVHAGGIHLEMTGDDVTECLGGSLPLCEADLPRRYLTHCDPRLNETQALDLAAEAARLMRRRTRPASHAA